MKPLRIIPLLLLTLLFAQSLWVPVRLVNIDVVGVGRRSTMLCTRLVIAAHEVLAIAEFKVPSVAHVDPNSEFVCDRASRA